MPDNIFDRLSGGRVLDLGSRLSPNEIEVLGSRPFRTCPECMGECIMGIILGMTEDGPVALPIPCPCCGGEGEVAYITSN